jgi:hypothetical protein
MLLVCTSSFIIHDSLLFSSPCCALMLLSRDHINDEILLPKTQPEWILHSDDGWLPSSAFCASAPAAAYIHNAFAHAQSISLECGHEIGGPERRPATRKTQQSAFWQSLFEENFDAYSQGCLALVDQNGSSCGKGQILAGSWQLLLKTASTGLKNRIDPATGRGAHPSVGS